MRMREKRICIRDTKYVDDNHYNTDVDDNGCVTLRYIVLLYNGDCMKATTTLAITNTHYSCIILYMPPTN